MADCDTSAIQTVNDPAVPDSISDGVLPGSAGSEDVKQGSSADPKPKPTIQHRHSFSTLPSKDKRQQFRDAHNCSRSLNSSPSQDAKDVPPHLRRSGRKAIRRPTELPPPPPNRESPNKKASSNVTHESAGLQSECSLIKLDHSSVSDAPEGNRPTCEGKNKKFSDDDKIEQKPPSMKPQPVPRGSVTTNSRTSSSSKPGSVSSKPPPPPKPKERKKPSLPPKPGKSSIKNATNCEVPRNNPPGHHSELSKATAAKDDLGSDAPVDSSHGNSAEKTVQSDKPQTDLSSCTSECNGEASEKSLLNDTHVTEASSSELASVSSSGHSVDAAAVDDVIRDGSDPDPSQGGEGDSVLASCELPTVEGQFGPEEATDKGSLVLEPGSATEPLAGGSLPEGQLGDHNYAVEPQLPPETPCDPTVTSASAMSMNPVLSELKTRLIRAPPRTRKKKPNPAPRQSACFTTEDLDLCSKPRHQVANSPSFQHSARTGLQPDDEESKMQLKRMRSKSLGLNVFPVAQPMAKPKVPIKPKLSNKLVISSPEGSDSETDSKLRNKSTKRPLSVSGWSKTNEEGRVCSSGNNTLSVVDISIDKVVDASHSGTTGMRGSLASQSGNAAVWHTDDSRRSVPTNFKSELRTKRGKGTVVKKRLKSKSDLDQKSKDESASARKLSKGTLFYVSEDTELNKELMFGSSKFYGSDIASDMGENGASDKPVRDGDRDTVERASSTRSTAPHDDPKLPTAEPVDTTLQTEPEPEAYENVPHNSQIYESIEIKKNEAGRLDLVAQPELRDGDADSQSAKPRDSHSSEALKCDVARAVDSGYSDKSSATNIYDNATMQLTPEAIAEDLQMIINDMYEPVDFFQERNSELYENVLCLENQNTLDTSTEATTDEKPYDSGENTSMMHDSDFDSFTDTESENEVEEECVRLEVKQVESAQPRDRLYNIAKELRDTEESYVKKLFLVDQVFQFKVLMENRNARMFPDDVIPQMFSNIKSIFQFHNDFLLPQLNERMSKWEEISKIGDLMKKFAPFLKLYTEYVKNFDHSLNVINSWMMKSAAFASIVEEIQKEPCCENLILQHHMLCPIQRVPRYELLLKEYIRHLPEESDDREDSLKALDLVSTAAAHSDEAMKKMEKFRSLLELSESFGGTLDIISPTRELIKKGKIMKVSARNGHLHERHLLLFNDMLILCQSIPIGIRATFRLKAKMDLEGMQVTEGDNLALPNTFVVKSKQKTIELHCASHDETVHWQVSLWNVIADYTKKQLSRRTVESPTSLTEAFQEQPLGLRAPTWIKDQETSMCMNCGQAFTTFKRRHHCRACGKVVCYKCSKNQVALAYDNNKLGRVCDHCYKKLSNSTFTIQGHLERAVQEVRTIRRKGVLGVKATDVSVISSYLWMSQDRKDWHKRFFTIHEDFVMYSFKAHQDVVALTSLPLPGFRVQLVSRGSRLDKDNVFRLWHPNQKNYFFEAIDAAHMKKWTQVLEKVVRAELPDDYASRKK